MSAKLVRGLVFASLLLALARSVSVYASEAERAEEIGDIIRRMGDKLGDAGLKSLTNYKQSLDAMSKGDLVAAWENELEAFRFAQKDFAETGAASLDSMVGRNYVLIPGQIAMSAQQSHDLPYDERLEIALSASLVQPERVWCGLYLIQIMEERNSYDAIIRYCEQRMAAGHQYYRVLRAKMLVHKQLELNYIALEEKYGSDRTPFEIAYELYTPTLLVQQLSIDALSELRAILSETGADFVIDCREIATNVYTVSWLPSREVVDVLDLCVDAVVKHIGSEIGAGLIQEFVSTKNWIEAVPAEKTSSNRETIGSAWNAHCIARRNGEIIAAPLSGWRSVLDAADSHADTEVESTVEEGAQLDNPPGDIQVVTFDPGAQQRSN